MKNKTSEPIQKIAVSSGSFSLRNLEELLVKKIDTVIAGEPMGQSMFHYPIKENALNIIFAGHYQTEVFGIKALQKEMQSHFGDRIQTEFIDLPID